ncbi:hypothetical protein SISSUDRAFT_1051020 [Sistotremastrum suecicum HHB10207 ss-3]|uniref:Uncharacterized protein n=1 Tax=Sistotremastrum suecicum HHB10207 ss-3 TaxID=1314776 RepID=A0A166AUB7_9AGAM|nr:hypothetical protein SISSUDRAFT_1051020 [Sistotremastrum suecicum HHB10207 ss-3]
MTVITLKIQTPTYAFRLRLPSSSRPFTLPSASLFRSTTSNLSINHSYNVPPRPHRILTHRPNVPIQPRHHRHTQHDDLHSLFFDIRSRHHTLHPRNLMKRSDNPKLKNEWRLEKNFQEAEQDQEGVEAQIEKTQQVAEENINLAVEVDSDSEWEDI